MSKSYLTRFPVLIAARLLSGWLDLCAVGKLEMAMCCSEGRTNLMDIFQRIATQFESTSNQSRTLQLLRWLATRRIRLSSLVLHRTMDLDIITVLHVLIIASAPRLEHVSIIDGNDSSYTVLSTMAMLCINLQEIAFIRSSLLSAQRLKVIRFVMCSDYDPAWFVGVTCNSVDLLQVSGPVCEQTQAGLLTMCPNLHRFERSEGITHIEELPTNLRALTLVRAGVFWGDCKSNLTELSLVECNFTQSQQLFVQLNLLLTTVLGCCRNVKALNLARNYALDSFLLGMVAKRYKHKLRYIKIRECTATRDFGIMRLCESCHLLQVVDISYIGSLSVDVIAYVVKERFHLHTLFINGLKLSNYVLECIANSNIEVLEMNNTYGYSPEGLKLLMFGCARLRSISINNTNVSELVKIVWEELRPKLKFVLEMDVSEMTM